jgi:hypothetical protein
MFLCDRCDMWFHDACEGRQDALCMPCHQAMLDLLHDTEQWELDVQQALRDLHRNGFVCYNTLRNGGAE